VIAENVPLGTDYNDGVAALKNADIILVTSIFTANRA
jgi:hypothetical protein